jgi:phosphatidylserine/phosphatidylglycerophosphate/cardiolipin synthase-like enzyme
MRYLALLALFACTKTAPADDDGTPPDVPGTPGVGCAATSPRAVELQAFAAPVGFEDRVTAFIDNTHTTLDVAMYLFTVTAIADRVIAAHQRGVGVRVLLDPDEPGNDSTRTKLMQAGVPTRNAPSIYSFSHQKYLIGDKQTSLIMSANFNADAVTPGSSGERNYGVVDGDPDDLSDLQAIFEMDWAAGGNEPPKPADLSCTRLVVSPNNSKQRVLDLVGSAQSTLEVEALYVSETTVRDAIVAAQTRGVAVRVILEASEDSSGTIPYLQGMGVQVHDASGFFCHAKLIVADGVAMVGSENYSFTSLTKNREVGVYVPAAVSGPVTQQFDTDWSNTH